MVQETPRMSDTKDKDKKYLYRKKREKEMIESLFANLRGLLSEEDFKELKKNDELLRKLWKKVEAYTPTIKRVSDEKKRAPDSKYDMCEYCGQRVLHGGMKDHVATNKCKQTRVTRAVAGADANMRSNPERYYVDDEYRREIYKKVGEAFGCSDENPIRVRDCMFEVPGAMKTALEAPNGFTNAFV